MLIVGVVIGVSTFMTNNLTIVHERYKKYTGNAYHRLPASSIRLKHYLKSDPIIIIASW